MKLTKTQIRALLLKYDTRNVAGKMLQTVEKSTPQEIGRVILRSKRDRQLVINLEAKN